MCVLCTAHNDDDEDVEDAEDAEEDVEEDVEEDSDEDSDDVGRPTRGTTPPIRCIVLWKHAPLYIRAGYHFVRKH